MGPPQKQKYLNKGKEMQSNRKSGEPKSDQTSTSTNFSSWLLCKTISLIKYPLEHPFKTVFYLCSLYAAVVASRAMAKNDEPAEAVVPIESLHTAYRGPSVLYFRDHRFNPTRDLVGWTTDIHPTGLRKEEIIETYSSRDYSDDELMNVILHPYFVPDYSWEGISSSFYIDDLPDKEKSIIKHDHCDFYSDEYYNYINGNYGFILGSGSKVPFGLYGYPTIEALVMHEDPIKYHPTNRGFIAGLQGIANEAYYSYTKHDNTAYQLAKIDINTIDMSQLGRPYEVYRRPAKIAHIYIKDNEVQNYRPSKKTLGSDFCEDRWSNLCCEKYIKTLPNFADMVDWVIDADDLPKVLEGKDVPNLMNQEPTNVLAWQNEQQRKSKTLLDNYSIFSLSRPLARGISRYDEASGEYVDNPPISFKIAK